MRENGAFREGQIIHNALGDNMPVSFAEIPKDSLTFASHRYGADKYRGLQVFWPDQARKLPWEPGVDAKMAAIQQRMFGLGKSPPVHRPH